MQCIVFRLVCRLQLYLHSWLGQRLRRVGERVLHVLSLIGAMMRRRGNVTPAKLDDSLSLSPALVALGHRLCHKHGVRLADRRQVLPSLLRLAIILSSVRSWLIEHSLRDFETLPDWMAFSHLVQGQVGLCLLQLECIGSRVVVVARSVSAVLDYYGPLRCQL